MKEPLITLPPSQATELALSVERAYSENKILDRLGAIWAVTFAKCTLAQWAIQTYLIPINGLIYIWSLTFIMLSVVSVYYLHAHQTKLQVLMHQLRVQAALSLGALIAIGFVLYAHWALAVLSTTATAGLVAVLMGMWSLVRATLRRAWEPMMGALLWWGIASEAFKSADRYALLWVGLGLLFAQALPGFMVARRTARYRV